MNDKIINSKKSLEDYKLLLDEQFEEHRYLRVTVKNGKQRTLTQNAALHKYCKMVADELNEQGQDFRIFIKAGYPVKFSQELVKEYVWRPVQKALTGNESTIDPKTHEYGEIYDCVNLKLGEHGIHIPWPSKEDIE